jgi:hypothetical protein
MEYVLLLKETVNFILLILRFAYKSIRCINYLSFIVNSFQEHVALLLLLQCFFSIRDASN